ncbi:flagellar motor stator protein MotA [Erythrobacteraceae bacterium CFH 75059]|uniref:flagellar motor stator protein MotA n=1 Tax=Qipengyuania thermophila TaxID=2509361 RepID=UPI001020613B|nr:flagellar motor stator protein MotA [Qipengyuania thermophila]TCD06283.1 flagellar motor stator protein MotA [Erythrobacteraceae bacterium CFH 75059]
MFPALGIAVLLVMVFGGFALTGGAIGPVLAAVPFEMMIIGGAAAGALIAGNSLHELKALGAGLVRVFKGPRYSSADHVDAIALSARLMRLYRQDGPLALEQHVENPRSSPLFGEFPRIVADPHLVQLLADPLMLLVVSSGSLDPHAVEEVLDNAIRARLGQMDEPAHALRELSDALPALGIVAAVLGVIKTMGSIDQPPPVLGKMIGAALVGTFLGVLLAYGIVGPLAARLRQINAQDQQILHSVKQVIVASLHGHPHALAVEGARSGLPDAVRPSLTQLLDLLKGR